MSSLGWLSAGATEGITLEDLAPTLCKRQETVLLEHQLQCLLSAFLPHPGILKARKTCAPTPIPEAGQLGTEFHFGDAHPNLV